MNKPNFGPSDVPTKIKNLRMAYHQEKKSRGLNNIQLKNLKKNNSTSTRDQITFQTKQYLKY